MENLLPESSSFPQELSVAIDAARQAASVVNRFYSEQSGETYTKGDGSPVTDADFAADSLLRTIIGDVFPGDAFLTEEGAQDLERRNHDRVWIIDPIDGTAQFIAGTGRFDILIALAIGGRPVVAVTIQPTTSFIHAAVTGEGAWRITPAGTGRFLLGLAPNPPRIVGSKYYRGYEGHDIIATVAARLGAPDPPTLDVGFQPRAFDPSHRIYDAFIGLWHPPGQSAANEWDIAAPDLIVNEAGGRCTDLWGRDFLYNKRNTHISGGLLVSASEDLHETLLISVEPHLPVPAPALDPAEDLDKASG